MRRRLRLLAQSPLFDREWYVQTYSDVRDSGVDPARHYLESGWREGRDPGPNFSTASYLKANPDVAAMDLNPLLHFIEFGQAEGRGRPSHGSPPRALLDPEKSFGPAAALLSFGDAVQTTTAWRRAGQIKPQGPDTLSIGEIIVGLSTERVSRAEFDEGLALLQWLSGKRAEPPHQNISSLGSCPDIRDVWHGGRRILRVRWKIHQARPLVVRAVQQIGAQPELVGEALITTDVDLFDAKLANPHFPLLLLFCDAEGQCRGFRLLHFPSLCRGGVHYSEWLALAEAEAEADLNIGRVDQRLGEALWRLRRTDIVPLIARLSVEISGATGTHGLFQQDFQSWLATVMRVPVQARPKGDVDATARYLEKALAVAAPVSREDGVTELRLAHNMVPAIGALVGVASNGPVRGSSLGSMVVSSSDYARPSVLVRAARGMAVEDVIGAPGTVPMLVPIRPDAGLSDEVMLLALKQCEREAIPEAQLLFPDGFEATTPEAHDIDVSWLIAVEDLDPDQLRWTLESLKFQTGSHRIILVGRPSQELLALAEEAMGRPAIVADSPASAMGGLDTELVGQIGGGIILHDRRTVTVLANALAEAGVEIVSAPVISWERRGKKGTLITERDQTDAAFQALPGAFFAIDGEPGDFWIGRRGAVASGSPPIGKPAARHMLCTQVSASRTPPAVPGIAIIPNLAAEGARLGVSFERLAG